MKELSNGVIQFKGKVSAISPGLTLQEFMQSDLYSDIQEEFIQDFSRFKLHPQEFDGNKMGVSLLFNNQNHIFLVNMSKIIDEDQSWNSWSEENELKRKKEHDKLLEKWIGTLSCQYKWGEITSDYDPRSGSSMITIRYF